MQVEVGRVLVAAHADLVLLVEVGRGGGAVPGEGVRLLFVFVLFAVLGNRERVDEVSRIGTGHVVGSLAPAGLLVEEIRTCAGGDALTLEGGVVQVLVLLADRHPAAALPGNLEVFALRAPGYCLAGFRSRAVVGARHAFDPRAHLSG